MPLAPPSDAVQIDVLAYYNAAVLSNVAQNFERDRLLAAASALRREGYSIREISSLLGLSYGTVARALSHQLVPSYGMRGILMHPMFSAMLPESLIPDAFAALGRMVWRHSPDALTRFDSDFRDGEFSSAEYAHERGIHFEHEPSRPLTVFDVIAAPEHHLDSPVEVTAQGVAHALNYLIDGSGHIYDASGVWIAQDMSQLARALVALNWIAPGGAGVS